MKVTVPVVLAALSLSASARPTLRNVEIEIIDTFPSGNIIPFPSGRVTSSLFPAIQPETIEITIDDTTIEITPEPCEDIEIEITEGPFNTPKLGFEVIRTDVVDLPPLVLERIIPPPVEMARPRHGFFSPPPTRSLSPPRDFESHRPHLGSDFPVHRPSFMEQSAPSYIFKRDLDLSDDLSSRSFGGEGASHIFKRDIDLSDDLSSRSLVDGAKKLYERSVNGLKLAGRDVFGDFGLGAKKFANAMMGARDVDEGTLVARDLDDLEPRGFVDSLKETASFVLRRAVDKEALAARAVDDDFGLARRDLEEPEVLFKRDGEDALVW
ncbi:hypothetical protein H0H93_008987 [Arthromyces matolae]|nr:hypothetical protein H0H93_008987 [Arthromyces matolae]